MRAMRYQSRGRLRAEHGGTLLETALVLPPFFLLLFGLFEFSIVLCGYCSSTYVSRIAVRYASMHSATSLAPCTSTCISTIVRAHIWAPSGSVTVIPTWSPGNTVGSTINISISIAYPVGLPFIPAMTMTSSAQRVITR